jgi:hypothetical protein
MHYKNLAFVLFLGFINTTITWGAEKAQKRESASPLTVLTEGQRMDDAHILLQNTLMEGIDSLDLVDRYLILKACEQLSLNIDQTARRFHDIKSLEECLRDLAESRRSDLIDMIVKEKFESPLKPELKSTLELREEAEALKLECSNKAQELSTLREQFEQKLKEERTLKFTTESILSKKEQELQSVKEQTLKSKQERLKLKEKREQDEKRKAERAERKRVFEQEQYLVELQMKLLEEKLKAKNQTHPQNRPEVVETTLAADKGKGEEVSADDGKANSQELKAKD